MKVLGMPSNEVYREEANFKEGGVQAHRGEVVGGGK